MTAPGEASGEDPGGAEVPDGAPGLGETAGAGQAPAWERVTQRIAADRDAHVAGRDTYAAARDVNVFVGAADAGSAGDAGTAGGAGASAWGTAVLRAPTGRLPERVRGRDELLDRLAGLLEHPDGRVHVLAGLGGTGKSTIALALAEEAAGLGISAWWVPAVEAETMTARLLELAEDLGAPPAEVAQARAGHRNPADLLWRCLGQRGPWLLILDNVDDPRRAQRGRRGRGLGCGLGAANCTRDDPRHQQEPG